MCISHGDPYDSAVNLGEKPSTSDHVVYKEWYIREKPESTSGTECLTNFSKQHYEIINVVYVWMEKNQWFFKII